MLSLVSRVLAQHGGRLGFGEIAKSGRNRSGLPKLLINRDRLKISGKKALLIIEPGFTDRLSRAEHLGGRLYQK